MNATKNAAVPDYQRQFSARSIKNYIASALVPFFSNGFSSMLFSTYLTFVYTEYLGVSAAAISAAVSVGVVIDAITDFLMGALTDRCITRWGKAKHWFFISALPMCLCIALMFMVPESGTSTLKVAWVFIVYNIFCLCNTTVRVPANALPSLVSDNPKVRGNMAWAFNITATLAVSALGWIVTPMLKIFGDNLRAYQIVAAVCAALSLITMLIAGILLTEQRGKDEWAEIRAQYQAQKGNKKESFLTQMKNLLKNKYWVHYLVINLANGAGINFVFGVMAYWMQFVVGDQSYAGVLMTVLNIPTLFGCMLYAIIAQKVSSKQLGLWGCMVQAVFCLLMWIIGAGNMTVFLILMAVKCFIGGIISPVPMSIVPDIVDYGEWKTGARQDGLCNSGVMLASKIMAAIATAVVGVILSASGYVGGGQATASAVSAINFLFLGIPCITMFLAAILWAFFKLDTKQAEACRAEVKARREAYENSKKNG